MLPLSAQQRDMDTKGKKIILGSGSPRRKELLEGLGITFIVDTGNSFDEDIDIEISIPVSLLIPHYKMPVPEFTVLDSFDKKYNFSDLFSIQQTDKYFDLSIIWEMAKGGVR